VQCGEFFVISLALASICRYAPTGQHSRHYPPCFVLQHAAASCSLREKRHVTDPKRQVTMIVHVIRRVLGSWHVTVLLPRFCNVFAAGMCACASVATTHHRYLCSNVRLRNNILLQPRDTCRPVFFRWLRAQPPDECFEFPTRSRSSAFGVQVMEMITGEFSPFFV